MECPSGIRVCPNGWTDCNLCAHNEACKNGTYTAELEDHELETDLGIVIEDIELPMPAEVVESDASTRGTWASRFNAMTEAERWEDIRKYHPPNLLHKEPVKCMAGAIVPGGGGTVKVKKSKKGNKPTVYVWGENL